MKYPNSEISCPANAELIPITDIQVEERGRKDKGDIESLAESIQDYGLITPICLTDDNVLVAGERRLLAHQLLGLSHIAFVRRDNLSEAEKLQLELVENLDRLAMKWHEDCLLIYRIDQAKRKADKAGELDLKELAILEATGGQSWGQKETGKLMGYSIGQVSEALRVAKEVLNGDEEIIAAPNIKGAIDILTKRREQEILAAMKTSSQQTSSEGTQTKATSKSSSPSSPAGFSGGQLGGGVFDILAGAPQPKDPDTKEVVIPLSDMFLNITAEKWLGSMPDNSVGHIITDPPYAIDMSNLSGPKLDDELKDSHQVKENLELLEWFVFEAYRVLRDKSFFFMWCDPMHFSTLHDWGVAAGFHVQRWPLVWHKLSPSKNQAPHVNTTKDYEICIKMRKGTPNLNTPIKSSIITSDNPDSRLYDNPFAKPFAVWEWLIDMACLPSSDIVDPFGGNFSLARAAINKGMCPRSGELSEKQYNKGINDMKKFFSDMHRGQVKFT